MLPRKWRDSSEGNARTRAFISSGLALGAGATIAITVGWDALWMKVPTIVAGGWLGMVVGWLAGELSERNGNGTTAQTAEKS